MSHKPSYSGKRMFGIKQLFAICFFAFAMSAWAEGSLVSEMQAYVVSMQPDGNEAFHEATSVEPGQLIEYRLLYRNVGVAPLNGLAVTGPVPKGTAYVGATAESAVVHVFEASIDGGSSWHREPLMRKVKQADGTERQEVVPAREYTHVRWLADEPLAAEATHEYRYRVQVKAEE